MAKLIEEIILKVGVDTKGLNEKLAKAGQGFEKLGDQAGGTGETIKKKTIPALKKGGVALTDLDKKLNPHIKKVEKASKGWNKFGKAVAKFKPDAASTGVVIAGLALHLNSMNKAVQDAERLGVVTQDLVDLQGVASRFGSSAEDLTQGLKNVSEAVSEAFNSPDIEKARMFKEIGIDVKEIIDLKADKQFIAVSKALAGMTNQARRQEVQLLLLSDEGFKLSTTMNELAVNADGAKASVRALTGEFNVEQIKEMNSRLSDMKLRLQGVANATITLGLDVFDEVDSFVEDIVFTMHGLNTAQERYNDQLAKEHVIAVALYAKHKKERAAELKFRDEREERQKKHTERLAGLLKDVEAQEGKGQGSKQADIDFKKRQKVFDDKKKADDKAHEDKQKQLDERVRGIFEEGMAGQKVLDDAARARKRDLIDRLREAGGGSVNIAGDAGSVQNQILQAEVSSRNTSKLSLADKLEAEIMAEDKAAQAELVEKAKEQVTQLKLLNKAIRKQNNNVRGIKG